MYNHHDLISCWTYYRFYLVCSTIPGERYRTSKQKFLEIQKKFFFGSLDDGPMAGTRAKPFQCRWTLTCTPGSKHALGTQLAMILYISAAFGLSPEKDEFRLSDAKRRIAIASAMDLSWKR